MVETTRREAVGGADCCMAGMPAAGGQTGDAHTDARRRDRRAKGERDKGPERLAQMFAHAGYGVGE